MALSCQVDSGSASPLHELSSETPRSYCSTTQEATSALDTESEKIVQNALDEAAKVGDRITFAVAHCLSTIKDADVICVFYNGSIAEVGTHAELVAQCGIYQGICEAQALN